MDTYFIVIKRTEKNEYLDHMKYTQNDSVASHPADQNVMSYELREDTNRNIHFSIHNSIYPTTLEINYHFDLPPRRHDQP